MPTWPGTQIKAISFPSLAIRPFATELQPWPWLCALGKDTLFVLLTECSYGQLTLYTGYKQQRFRALRAILSGCPQGNWLSSISRSIRQIWCVFVWTFFVLNLPGTSLWGICLYNMHPSSTIMTAFTLIPISFPEALVHILYRIASTRYSFKYWCHILIQCNYSFM